MLPRFNSLPYRSNQVQNDGTTGSSAVQQVIPPGHCQGNPTNLFPNSAQIQPQMSMVNPHTATSFNNSNTYLSNGSVAMPNMSISASVGPSNHLLHPQNVMPFLGQCHNGFMTPLNPIQLPNQLFAHASVNPAQYLTQNACLPNGQLYLESPMQNVNQFVQMPMPNYTQMPCNMPLYPSQVSQALGPQNPTFLANPQFGLVHSNAVVQPGNQDQHNFVRPAVDTNTATQAQNGIQQSQGNLPMSPPFGSAPQQQTQKDFHPPALKMSQGSLQNGNGISSSHTSWKNPQSRNFTRNPKRDGLHKGFPQNHNMKNAKGKFGFHKKNGGKGFKNDGGREFATKQTPVQHRRSLFLSYTEQEIKQWREERRKNFPSKANLEKKLAEKMTEPEVAERYTQLRREQLKEILAKQAELGCEVAEIPSYYLSDSEKPVHGKVENMNTWTRKERFQNKFRKRGRFDRFPKKQQKLAEHNSSHIRDQDARFSKKPKLPDKDGSSKLCLNNGREPTLLQRLLSADIRRDRSRLLQVFRFVVMNSFFRDWPEKPLRFPLVIVEETGLEGVGEVVEGGKSLSLGNGASEIKKKPKIIECDADEFDTRGKATTFGSLNSSVGGKAEETEEEEGEIID